MKILIIFLLTISSAFADEWTPADKYRETTFLTLHTVDWLQTRTVANNSNQWHEQNFILGEHPSIGQVNIYFLTTAVLHVIVADQLSPEWRKAFQYVSIGISGGAILNNISLGIRMDL